MTSAPASTPARQQLYLALQLMFVALLGLSASGCGHSSTPVAPTQIPETTRVQVSATEAAVVIDTPSAEFTISPAGYIAAKLMSQNQKLSLDDAGNDSGLQIIAAGK